VLVRSDLNRTVGHEGITMNYFIKQTEFQKQAPILKSWKIKCSEAFRVTFLQVFVHTLVANR